MKLPHIFHTWENWSDPEEKLTERKTNFLVQPRITDTTKTPFFIQKRVCKVCNLLQTRVVKND